MQQTSTFFSLKQVQIQIAFLCQLILLWQVRGFSFFFHWKHFFRIPWRFPVCGSRFSPDRRIITDVKPLFEQRQSVRKLTCSEMKAVFGSLTSAWRGSDDANSAFVVDGWRIDQLVTKGTVESKHKFNYVWMLETFGDEFFNRVGVFPGNFMWSCR